MVVDTTTRVFLCYRREDTRHLAGRLGDRLTQHFGKVFMDIDNIEPGADFTAAIRDAVGEGDVLLALIGPQWIDARDKKGRRRLDDPDDWIVGEIRVALERDIRVIPVLVDSAVMPDRDDLPTPIVPLANRHAVTLRHESFSADVAAIGAIIERLGSSSESRVSPVHVPAVGQAEVRDLSGETDLARDPRYEAPSAAFFSQQWNEAIAGFEKLLVHYPGNRLVSDRLKRAREHRQLADGDTEAKGALLPSEPPPALQFAQPEPWHEPPGYPVDPPKELGSAGLEQAAYPGPNAVTEPKRPWTVLVSVGCFVVADTALIIRFIVTGAGALGLTFGALYLLFVLIMFAGRNWARITVAVFAVFLPAMLSSLGLRYTSGTWGIPGWLGPLVLGVVGIAFSFLRLSNCFFKDSKFYRAYRLINQ